MSNIFSEVETLRRKGKVHTRLILLVYGLIVLALAMAAIISYNIAFKGTNSPSVIALIAIGFVLGRYLFARINVVDWDERKEMVKIGRMDILGFIVLVAYIAFDFILKYFLNGLYGDPVGVFLLAAVFGTFIGRIAGLVSEVHRVFKESK
ncbi:MAG: hypothetical protein Q8L64_06970 [bacterium]|nr:hypothetical protein [bacterium]